MEGIEERVGDGLWLLVLRRRRRGSDHRDRLIRWSSCRRMELLIRKSRIDFRNLDGLLVRMNHEILKLVYSRWNKKAQIPNSRYIHTVGSACSQW